MLLKEKAIKTEKIKHGKSFRTHYIFNCECGKEMSVRSDALNKHPGHCLICAHKKRPYETYYNDLVRVAKKRNKPISISYEDFLEFTKIKNCHYCDNFINWQQHTTYRNVIKRTFLDRKNNDIGYLKDNIVVCCPDCNFTKGNRYSYDEFLLFVPVMKKINQMRKNNEL